MSTVAIIAIAVGGTVVMAVGFIVLLRFLDRAAEGDEAEKKAGLERLRQEAPRRGWVFEDRNDAFTEVYNEQLRYTRQDPLNPELRYPKARSARNIVTGKHRGRPFLAGSFSVYRPGGFRKEGKFYTTRSITVRTPAIRPALVIRRVTALEIKINSGIGRGGLATGDPEFDSRFEVTTEHESFARAVLNPELVGYLKTIPSSVRGLWFLGDRLEVDDLTGDHRDPHRLLPALDLRCDILDRISPSVWS